MRKFLGKKAAGVLSALLMMGVYGRVEAKDYLNAYFGYYQGSTYWNTPVNESDSSNQFYINSSDPNTYHGANGGRGNVGIWVVNNKTVSITATEGDNTATSRDQGTHEENSRWWGISVGNTSTLNLTAEKGSNNIIGMGPNNYGAGVYQGSHLKMTAAKDNKIQSANFGVWGSSTAYWSLDKPITINITSTGGNNEIVADATSVSNRFPYAFGISANDDTAVNVTADGNNTISAKGEEIVCGIDAETETSTSYKANVKLVATNGSNAVSSTQYGIYSDNAAVSMKAYKDNTVTTTSSSGTEGIHAEADGAEVQLTAQHGNNEVTADYAVIGKTGGKVTFDAPEGTTKITGTTAGILSSTGASVTVNDVSDVSGSTVLQAESYQQDDTGANVGDPASVTVNYAGDSKITGDIILAYNNGTVKIAPAEDGAKETIVSDVMASGQTETTDDQGNVTHIPTPDEYVGGTVDIQLTNGSSLTGQTAVADNVTEDYGTVRGGTINLDLPTGSNWYMTGSSSVTNLSGDGGTVHFQNGGHSLQITNQLSGSHTFVLDLSKDGSQSDMIYMRQGTSDEQTLNIRNLQELSDSMEEGDAVRFAVVSESQNEFRDGKVYTADGINNKALKVEYRDVATDPLNTDAYNDAYNGDGTNKPTTAQVKAFYIDPFEDPQYVYLVLPETEEEQEPVVNDGAKSPGNFEGLLWRYVTDLDTFTKRDGQSLYFTPGADQGGWIRLGYRNFGVDGVGELDGNSYELGYTDVTKQTDEAKHRLSLSAAYSDPSGRWEGLDGDIDLEDFTVALYDTHEYYPSAEKRAAMPEWKQDSHAYWDNYLKYHHVRSDYSVRDRQTDTRYAGDFSRDVWNLSTEYGHRLYFDKGWFWVPQAQLQLSYVGGYDYYDSQNLHVDADHEWSLIGRLGFDLVRELDPKLDSKLYFKASVLHEFLDGSDVTVGANGEYYTDDGDYSGTWGVVGLGYSAKIGEQQYMYLDAERYFGNDFARTYGIRAGVNWKF